MKISLMTFFLILALTFGCQEQESCETLSTGHFKLYKENELIGDVYRKNNIQIEKYLKSDKPYIILIENKKGCEYYLKKYHQTRSIDTITVLVTYQKKGEQSFNYEIKAAYLDTLNYSFTGVMEKVSEEIDPDILKIFDEYDRQDNLN